jgi:hypothetical protein
MWLTTMSIETAWTHLERHGYDFMGFLQRFGIRKAVGHSLVAKKFNLWLNKSQA